MLFIGAKAEGKDLVEASGADGSGEESNSVRRVFPTDTVERIDRLETAAVAGMILPVGGDKVKTEVTRAVVGVKQANITVNGITAGYLSAARMNFDLDEDQQLTRDGRYAPRIGSSDTSPGPAIRDRTTS